VTIKTSISFSNLKIDKVEKTFLKL